MLLQFHVSFYIPPVQADQQGWLPGFKQVHFFLKLQPPLPEVLITPLFWKMVGLELLS
jgi:hypothetical protein